MFGAAAVRNKKRKAQADRGEIPRGPYIKPFGPRFDSAELPYFKYKRAIAEAKELQQNIAKAKQNAARRKRAAAANGGTVGNAAVTTTQLLEDPEARAAALARVSSLPPDLVENRLKVRPRLAAGSGKVPFFLPADRRE